MAFDTTEKILAAGRTLANVHECQQAKAMIARFDSASNPDPELRSWIARLDIRLETAFAAHSDAMSKLSGVAQPCALDKRTAAIYSTIWGRPT
ncbi:MAG TPA: hypothetical protein VF450_12450 [Noviherbaspirillum sp.]